MHVRNDSSVRDLERCYREQAEPLLRFLIYRTGNRALAEDIVADTFERVLTSRRRFDPRRSSEKTWVFTIALNLLRDHNRRAAVAERVHALTSVSSSNLSHDPPSDASEHRDLIQRGLKTLAPEEREAIALRYGADLTASQIAKVTGQPLTTVEGRIYRSLRKLRTAMQ